MTTDPGEKKTTQGLSPTSSFFNGPFQILMMSTS